MTVVWIIHLIFLSKFLVERNVDLKWSDTIFGVYVCGLNVSTDSEFVAESSETLTDRIKNKKPASLRFVGEKKAGRVDARFGTRVLEEIQVQDRTSLEIAGTLVVALGSAHVGVVNRLGNRIDVLARFKQT
jgi:hypothetical protein